MSFWTPPPGGGIDEGEDIAEATGPYRDRVEVFALDPIGKVYGGRWKDDKTFAVPGGGIDEGEDVAEAAAREFKEETGLDVHNVRSIGIPDTVNPWSEEYRKSRPADRRHFVGSRTKFMVGDLLSTTPAAGKLDKWDAEDRRQYTLQEALKLMSAGNKSYHEPRRQLLQKLFEQSQSPVTVLAKVAAMFGAEKTAAPWQTASLRKQADNAEGRHIDEAVVVGGFITNERETNPDQSPYAESSSKSQRSPTRKPRQRKDLFFSSNTAVPTAAGAGAGGLLGYLAGRGLYGDEDPATTTMTTLGGAGLGGSLAYALGTPHGRKMVTRARLVAELSWLIAANKRLRDGLISLFSPRQ